MAKDDHKKQPPSLTEKTLSVRIPDEKHKALKTHCVTEDISLRGLILAAIEEIESGSRAGQALTKRAKEQDS